MKRLMISGLAAVALLAAATTMLRSHSPSPIVLSGPQTGLVAAISHRGRRRQAPDREIEDMSLVFSTAQSAKRKTDTRATLRPDEGMTEPN